MVKPTSHATQQHLLNKLPIDFEQIKFVLLKTIIKDLHGLPYPIAYRKLDVLKEWEKLFAQYPVSRDIWNGWARPDGSVMECLANCRELMQTLAPPNAPASSPQWNTVTSSTSFHLAINLAYQQRQGTIIEATPAMEVLLTQSDVDPDMPLSMLVPPYSAQYLRFGDHAAQALPAPTGRAIEKIDGVFCFSSPVVLADGTRTGVRDFTMAIILKANNVFSGCSTFATQIKDEQSSVSSWVDHILNKAVSYGNGDGANDYDKTMQAISYVAKVFLYMGLKDARQVAINAASQPPIGQPKLGKRRQGFLYDRIEVGPESLPQWDATDPSGLAVSPHWRRGHFRLQPHGPQASLRKVMFIMPTMVRADRLA